MQWDSNDPESFGWRRFGDIVPFRFGAANFPSGVDRLAVPLFTEVLHRLEVARGFALHKTGVLDHGNWGY